MSTKKLIIMVGRLKLDFKSAWKSVGSPILDTLKLPKMIMCYIDIPVRCSAHGSSCVPNPHLSVAKLLARY